MENTLTIGNYSKLDLIPGSKLKQLQYENDSWKRLLAFMIEENIHLKNRLSEILMDKFDKNLLEEADGFQTRFIKEDDLIGLLRHDVNEMNRLLVKDIFEDQFISKKIRVKLRNLRNNINTVERQSRKLKSDFNHFLSEKIL